MITIKKCSLDFIREPLSAPFGFKGGYLSELWQPVVRIESDEGEAVFPSVQSVLWSDPHVFTGSSEAGGNAKMFAVTERACRTIEGTSFTTPYEVTDYLAEALMPYAEAVCGFKTAKTFVLNSLVGIDLALWALYAHKNKCKMFCNIIPREYTHAFECSHKKLACIPLINYSVNKDEIGKLLSNGNALLKIKLGKYIGGQTGSEQDMSSMLEWDIKRVKEIHTIASQYSTDMTKSGKIRYYFDANGRYDTADRLMRFLDAIDSFGALECTELIEEPFAEGNDTDVSHMPVAIGADESAHSADDLKKRIEQGYKAAAFKPAAKTLSVSFEMAHIAKDAGIGYLTADLTVNPLLAMLNRIFASHLDALPGMTVGAVEVNGDQNYKNWHDMQKLLPQSLKWSDAVNGAFIANNDFLSNSGKIFETNGYAAIFER